jgi:hypothetical protein
MENLMRPKITYIVLIVMGFLTLKVSLAADNDMLRPAVGKSCRQADPFALDGARNIVQEEHFGIVNGELTAGVQYSNIAGVSGLWAPPYVSSDFKLDVTLFGRTVPADRYTWHPFRVERAGSVQGIAVASVTQLIPGERAGLLVITLSNPGPEARTVPLTITVSGNLDRVEWWEFARPESRTPTVPSIKEHLLQLVQGDQAIVLCADNAIHWEDTNFCGRGDISLPPSGSASLYIVFALGPAVQAKISCENIAKNPEKVMADAQSAYAGRLGDLFQKLPRLTSDNPNLESFYNRSLVPFIINRWDIPEFLLHPYFSTGGVCGGCFCNYLWDFGETWELFPLFDPDAVRTHIRQFLAVDMTKHFAFDPIGGAAWGPWYPVNQEKIVGLIYYYIKNTGDTAFLNDIVAGKTVLEHAMINAWYGDDPAKPVALIDYGPSNSHLELRRGFPYNHVMPDLNGRRYESYLLASQLAELGGNPMPNLRQRAEELKALLRRTLWNEQNRWFDFMDAEGKKDTRYTVQMFKLLASKVLDPDQETGLLDHLLSEKEFLSEFGLHSMSKTDVAYDQVDIDNGGGGSYVGFPPQIVERLYKAGKPSAAENILKRILWWGDRLPYWGDSIVANQIDYRKDTPLQCTIGSVAGAQCIIFGMFGVRAEFNGDIYINPHPPAFAARIELKGLRLRGHVLDIIVNGDAYEVRQGDKCSRAKVGQNMLIKGDRLMLIDM